MAGLGLSCRVFTDIDDPELGKVSPAFVLADCSPFTERDPIASALFKLGSLAPKHAVISRFPDLEPAVKLPLDTYLLERMLRRELNLDEPAPEADAEEAATKADP